MILDAIMFAHCLSAKGSGCTAMPARAVQASRRSAMSVRRSSALVVAAKAGATGPPHKATKMPIILREAYT